MPYYEKMSTTIAKHSEYLQLKLLSALQQLNLY